MTIHATKSKPKFQVEISADQEKEIERLMETCSIETKKNLFLNAMALLTWAVEEKKSGNAIGAIQEDEGRYKELVMPILQNLSL